MTTSKFTWRTLLIPLMIIWIPVISFYIIWKTYPIEVENIRWIYILIAFLFLLSWVTLVFGELRRRIIIVTVNANKVTSRNFLGYKKEFNFKDFDGFQISSESSRLGIFEVLFLVKNGKRIIHISEFHHRNYFEIKDAIKLQTNDLGFISLGYWTRLKEMFKKQ